MRSKYILPKIGSWLVLFGIIFTMIGFALSGFSLQKYSNHERRWFNVVDVYSE